MFVDIPRDDRRRIFYGSSDLVIDKPLTFLEIIFSSTEQLLWCGFQHSNFYSTIFIGYLIRGLFPNLNYVNDQI